MEQVVAYKVVDKIQLKHLYLVYCISNLIVEKHEGIRCCYLNVNMLIGLLCGIFQAEMPGYNMGYMHKYAAY
jgi:hypothetical protein